MLIQCPLEKKDLLRFLLQVGRHPSPHYSKADQTIMSTITLNSSLTVICFRREKTKAGPWFVVREFDTKVIRARDKNSPKGRGPSEQAIRASIRQAILNMGLKSERASKGEIRLLKGQGILGKRAPSCSLLNAEDMIRLLRAFGKNECAHDLHQAMIANRKSFPGMQLEMLAIADEPARKHIKVAGGKRVPANPHGFNLSTGTSTQPAKRRKSKSKTAAEVSGLDALLSAVEQAFDSSAAKPEPVSNPSPPSSPCSAGSSPQPAFPALTLPRIEDGAPPAEVSDDGDEEAEARPAPSGEDIAAGQRARQEVEDDGDYHLHALPSPSPRGAEVFTYGYNAVPALKSKPSSVAAPAKAWGPTNFTTPVSFNRPSPGQAGSLRPSQLIMGMGSPQNTIRVPKAVQATQAIQLSPTGAESRDYAAFSVNAALPLPTPRVHAYGSKTEPTPASLCALPTFTNTAVTPPPPLIPRPEKFSEISHSPSPTSPPVSPERNSPSPVQPLFEEHSHMTMQSATATA
eukprot:g51306.t1